MAEKLGLMGENRVLSYLVESSFSQNAPKNKPAMTNRLPRLLHQVFSNKNEYLDCKTVLTC